MLDAGIIRGMKPFLVFDIKQIFCSTHHTFFIISLQSSTPIVAAMNGRRGNMMSARPSTSARQVAIIMVAGMIAATSAFQLPHSHHKFSLQSTSHHVSHRVRILSLEMASSGQDGGSKGTGKRKRRKRKKVEADSTPTLTATKDAVEASTTVSEQETDEKKQSAKAMAQQILAQEEMMFDDNVDDDLTSFTPQKLEENDRIAAAAQRAGYSVSGGQGTNANDGTQLEDFFDSREFLQRKREKQLEDASKEGKPSSAVPTKKKIKRSDIKAYTKLLELDPIADEDDSYFEDEGIDVISALLGDVEPGIGNDSDESANKSGKKVQKRTSFLGVGSGPLQVGHTFGALSVILCAFVEYPGFPLTNLPDQLRGALQGGTCVFMCVYV